jgi:SAM-dependent methyltransferase
VRERLTEARRQLEQVPACPVCGGRHRSVLHEGLEDKLFAASGRWRLIRCGSCRCAYLDPRPTRETIAAAYVTYFPREESGPRQTPPRWREALRNGYLNRRFGYAFSPASRLGPLVVPLFRKRRWNAALTVRELAKPPGQSQLLDVGFGDAAFLRAMRAAGWQVRGLEPDAGAVEAARNAGLDIERGTLEGASFEAGSFDAITLSHVIEHLHDPVAALETCFRLLRPNGVLWLATPNIDSPAHRRFGRDWFGLDPPRHLVIFSRIALHDALGAAGFVRPRWSRSYRGELVVAASEALAAGRDAAASWTPHSRRLRNLARAYDLAAALRPEWGEELVALAERPG